LKIICKANSTADSVRELYQPEDGYGGQNRNQVLARFPLFVIDSARSMKIYYYPVHGGSDRYFAVVKRPDKEM
jgi:hypothetical protein